jgi:hypothetical protein
VAQCEESVTEAKKKPKSQSEANVRPEAGGKPDEAPSLQTSGRLPFKNWDALKAQLVGAVRRSERLTKEDLSIRINARK